jgi:hypothetical protein
MCVVKDRTLNFERGSFKYHDKRTYVYPSGYHLKIGACTQLTTYPNPCPHLITADDWVSKTQNQWVLYISENSENHTQCGVGFDFKNKSLVWVLETANLWN